MGGRIRGFCGLCRIEAGEFVLDDFAFGGLRVAFCEKQVGIVLNWRNV